MKKLLLISLHLAFCISLFAQSWNPSVSQGIVSPAPLLPVEFNGTGELSFNFVNTGGSSLPLTGGDELTLVVELSYGIPNNVDPLAALTGNAIYLFDWTYDTGSTTYTGIQNQEISGSYSGSVIIQYQVTQNSYSPALNGFVVGISPPLYTNGFNDTNDDAVSSYTIVQAFDHGDAPSSYGEAKHEIYLHQPGGLYESYYYLGSSVDPEDSYQASGDGLGDDISDTDDEDGVTFPSLVPGSQVTIPVVITIMEAGFGYLYGWIDWNQDGDFEDTGELITPANTYFLESGTINLTVDVPVDAVIGETFARFRVGSDLVTLTSPSSDPSGFGEVEDYKVNISSALPIELDDFRGFKKEKHNHLYWTTIREVNSERFYVERRMEHEDTFTRIAEISAAGNSLERKHYEINDFHDGREGTYYYRLGQLCKNGSLTFSEVIALHVAQSAKNELKVYPNPASSHFNLEFDISAGQLVQIEIVNQQGKTFPVVQEAAFLDAGHYKKKINIPGLAEGIYYVKLTSEHNIYFQQLSVLK